GDDLVEGRSGLCRAVTFRPDQRSRLGEVADEVIGKGEQNRIRPLRDQPAHEGGLGRRESELAGDRGQSPASIGVGCRGEILAEQPDLAVTGRREDEGVEKTGERLHSPSSPSRPSSDSARARMPREPAAWTMASSAPWVIHTSGAATSSMVALSSSQSAWSEMMSGSS